MPSERSSRFKRTVVGVALLAIGSCSESSSPGATFCSGDVTVDVSSGTSPTFTWSPACRVVAVLVENSFDADLWSVESGSGIESGLVYGTTPPGAFPQFVASLFVGQTYEVIVYRGSLGNLVVAGRMSFTP